MGCAPSTDTGVAVASTPPVPVSRVCLERVHEERKDDTQSAGTNNTEPSMSLETLKLAESDNSPGYIPGYASGASTPPESNSLDGSFHGERTNSSLRGLGGLGHSNSVIGLDSMIEARKEEGDLMTNVVHIEVPFGKPIEEVYDGVHNGPVLGSGISGLVRLATHKATGVKYAVKCLDLGLVKSEEGLQRLKEEILIMCQLDHPNIVRLEEVYEGHSEIYLVQELCLGGELFDRLDEQPDYHYTEAECARLVKQMLCAVRYLHSRGIVHRDLKLENFLFSSTSPDSELKMIDFGLSKHFKFGEVHHEAVGTPYSVAPEVIRGSYDERCDIWAIGVITYLLLSGDPPFGGCGGPEPLMTVRSNILEGAFEFEPEDIWSIVSPQAKAFINSLLVIDPLKRPTARDAQKHQWVREWAKRDRTMNNDSNKLNPNVVRALVTFKEFSDMRKLLCEVLSFTLLPDQIKDLRKEFEKMDTDGSGEISLGALKHVLMSNAGAGSLGALTEDEVEDIFNAMRVSKTETRIHWHEFIAAGLSQCQVDERNLRLAFDRLDSDHKGFITFENVMDLMGTSAIESEDAMRRMWGDSVEACNCNQARISYDDFLLLMKGQTKEGGSDHLRDSVPSVHGLHVVHEMVNGEDDHKSDYDCQDSSSPGMPLETISDAMNVEGNYNLIHALTPPASPSRGAMDYITPSGNPALLAALAEGMPTLPELPGRPLEQHYVRRRSRSVDDQDPTNKNDLLHFAADARRAMALPEHDGTGKKEIENLIRDDRKTPLVVNRQLYRAHRQMRLAVLEATKRFEEQQARRAREILMANREKEGLTSDAPGPVGARLMLRHGVKKQVSNEAVKNWLQKSKEENDALLEKASKRSGRVKSRRQKTKSDMSGMLNLSSDLQNSGTGSLRDNEGHRVPISASSEFPPVRESRGSGVMLSHNWR